MIADPSGRLHRWVVRYRTLISALLGLVFFFLARPTPSSLMWFAPFIFAGEGLRMWASGHIDKRERLTMEGPYSLSRNPLYVGNFLLAAGFVLMAARPILILPFLIIFGLIYYFTIRREEAGLAKLFPEDWQGYSTTVPRLVPVLNWPAYVPGDFRWPLLRKHREYNNIVAIVIVYALFWVKALV